jgi:hypothetical protein
MPARKRIQRLLPATFSLLEPDQHRHDENEQHACYQPVHVLPFRFHLTLVDMI